MTNSGAISGGNEGIFANEANVTNSGSVSGGMKGIFAITNANVTSSGAISGGVKGLFASNDANVTNSGTVSGGLYGISAGNNVHVTNTGVISGGLSGIYALGAGSTLVNSGTIIGASGTAIDFSAASADTLTFLPGSRVIGAINLGSGDIVNVVTGHDASSVTTFNPNGSYTLNVTGSRPYAVSGNSVAIVEPTSMGAMNSAISAFTRTVSGLASGRLDEAGVKSSSALDAVAPLAFAPTNGALSVAPDAYAAISGTMLAYADTQSAIFRNPTQTTADGYGAWARGFYGQHFDNDNGTSLRNVTNFYGATLGLDGPVSSELRIGAYLGGGSFQNTTSIQSSSSKSDLVFGGVYGRYSVNAAFMDFALMGGEGHIHNSRTVFNNLAQNGVELASSSYNTIFVSPEVAAGYRYKINGTWTLTPSVHLRYLATRFGSFAETGSAADMSVGTHTAQSLEERGQLKLSGVFPATGYGDLAFSISGGVIAQQRVGNSAINAVLLGQALSFATPGKADTTGAYVASHVGLGLTRNVALFVGGDYARMSDRSSTATVNGGVKTSF